MSYFMEQGDERWSCKGKARHRDFRTAKVALARSIEQYGDQTLVCYPCWACDGWHVGHPPRNVQKRLKYDRLLKLIDRANGR